MDADWHPFAQTVYKSTEGDEWQELYEHYKEIGRAAGAKKPSDHQKARALWETEGGKG